MRYHLTAVMQTMTPRTMTTMAMKSTQHHLHLLFCMAILALSMFFSALSTFSLAFSTSLLMSFIFSPFSCTSTPMISSSCTHSLISLSRQRMSSFLASMSRTAFWICTEPSNSCLFSSSFSSFRFVISWLSQNYRSSSHFTALMSSRLMKLYSELPFLLPFSSLSTSPFRQFLSLAYSRCSSLNWRTCWSASLEMSRLYLEMYWRILAARSFARFIISMLVLKPRSTRMFRSMLSLIISLPSKLWYRSTILIIYYAIHKRRMSMRQGHTARKPLPAQGAAVQLLQGWSRASQQKKQHSQLNLRRTPFLLKTRSSIPAWLTTPLSSQCTKALLSSSPTKKDPSPSSSCWQSTHLPSWRVFLYGRPCRSPYPTALLQKYSSTSIYALYSQQMLATS